jgi:hypothetical protein
LKQFETKISDLELFDEFGLVVTEGVPPLKTTNTDAQDNKHNTDDS